MMVHWLIRGVETLLLGVLLVFVGSGLYIGNLAYGEFRAAPWDQILGIENNAHNVETVQQAERRNGWEAIMVTAADGTALRGTYIEDAGETHKTVLLLHGLYQNRSMCMPYIRMYRNLGYNVLLVDLRGHGESGGVHTDWGISEIGDLDTWISYLKHRDSSMRIGMHGVSLGAAMALLYSGTARGRQLSFYISDSSYGNLMQLGREKMFQWAGDKRAVWGFNILNPFFQAAMYYHSGKVLSDLEPMKAVSRASSPVLFLHGGADELIPVQTVQELYQHCQSPRKNMHIFQHSTHAVGIETNRAEYEETVEMFLEG